MAAFSARDVCRALAKIPEGHSIGAQLLSASNDYMIRAWTLKGDLIAELRGHEAFIYSLAVLPDGKFVSSGEDRTVKIWQDQTCVQTITLPAVSVWTVATCANGDIIAGSSDKLARIFTTDPDRLADAGVEAEFSEAVRSSSIPQQTLGDINKTDMQGPDFLLRKSGTKDGQIQMIKETNGSVSAYSWSSTKATWDMVGTVVDSAGSGGKTTYKGKEYDYVFDVDIEDGKPPLKLPYNITENPHEVATRWLHDHELPMTYLEQTAQFIVNGTKGETLGQPSSDPRGANPWGSQTRYQPGQGPASRDSGSTKKLPQKEYISLIVGKPDATHQQIVKLNTQYSDSGESGLILSPAELDSLAQISKQLQSHKFESKTPLPATSALELCLHAAVRIATQWQPPNRRLAGLDMLRFLAAARSDLPNFRMGGDDIVTIVMNSEVFDSTLVSTNVKLAMVSIRLFANLMFGSEAGRDLLDDHFEVVLQHIKNVLPYCSKEPALAVAVTTYYLNLAVRLIQTPADTEFAGKEGRALAVVEAVSGVLQRLYKNSSSNGGAIQQAETEPVYRGLFAIGTILVGMRSSEVGEAAKTIFDVDTLLSQLRDRGFFNEPRFEGLVEEIQAALA
jgi:phospholipase A-2-activating protein